MAYQITAERRQQYRDTSIRSQQRKAALIAGSRHGNIIQVHRPRLDPNALMPLVEQTGLTALSLFSGGGGLDLGFERAGVGHAASYEILDICGETLRANRCNWKVCSGEDGDVTLADWQQYRGVDIVQGGPPCQPFSIAGKQHGANDPRNMWPAFVECVLQVKPLAFIAENVPGFLDPKFAKFVRLHITGPLASHYEIHSFRLNASEFGVPQARKRVFFVGFRRKTDSRRFQVPEPTHSATSEGSDDLLPPNLARHSLGLPDIGFDTFAPTLRSGFTGPRNTTGVVNSKASLSVWGALRLWPNGVQRTREQAAAYPPENGHQRLAVPDCALLQGFPEDWHFSGAVYQALGQIGNSVAPPVAYAVARSVLAALKA